MTQRGNNFPNELNLPEGEDEAAIGWSVFYITELAVWGWDSMYWKPS